MAKKHLRLRTFAYFLRPYQVAARRRRSAVFAAAMRLRPGMRVIDLGGAPMIWQFVNVPLEITLLNIEFSETAAAEAGRYSQHKFHFLKGDACDNDLPAQSFDLAFSNSVIEHVGDEARRAAFAHHVRRLAPKYWVQTPAKYFPIEAHNGMPFWWYYPESLRQRLIRDWRAELPDWTEMIEGTTLVERKELETIFPDSRIFTERVLGIPKSYAAFRVDRD
ncbi:class I SAM-dependent methyltransferase [Hyphomicrobium sp.]|uniref:SAM-dependent methyltransferase n=1 Tax=Hyphomicrobium sp. TaxID=82 RepID=UPI002D1BE87B|nr:class I SAM-dependent methyltransferase [Hyphomicrobium sp.]HRN87139.1 class I SAM-dependent methyltransferase [Hyphomicrobium sp.]HRQ25518.1 class I SAM-dependent methyltransferase [Hyphomicrobium sp.]